MTSCHLQSNYSSTVTLHGGPVVLRPVRATLCFELTGKLRQQIFEMSVWYSEAVASHGLMIVVGADCWCWLMSDGYDSSLMLMLLIVVDVRWVRSMMSGGYDLDGGWWCCWSWVVDVRRLCERRYQEVRWSLAVVVLCSPSETQWTVVERRSASVHCPGLRDGSLGKSTHSWYVSVCVCGSCLVSMWHSLSIDLGCLFDLGFTELVGFFTANHWCALKRTDTTTAYHFRCSSVSAIQEWMKSWHWLGSVLCFLQCFDTDGWWREGHPSHGNPVPLILRSFFPKQV